MADLRISIPEPTWRASLAAYADRVELVDWDLRSPQPEGRLDLVLLPYATDASPLRSADMERIGLVQSQSLGYDGVEDAMPPGGTYANAVGVHEESTAELALALALASLRDVDLAARQQPHAGWERPWGRTLIDARVLVLGVGGIGREVIARLSGFGCEIVRVASSARDDEHGHVHATDELPDLLPEADVVVVAVPHTPATERLVDDAFLAALPDGALVVNVSRGRVADTDAIADHTGRGRVRYATDVTEPEPLPDDHPLWTTPGVLITPHIGGKSAAMRPRIERVVRAQLDRLLAGEEPADVVVRT